jgi:hypothetical protein
MTHAFKGILLMELDTGAQTITLALPICDRPGVVVMRRTHQEERLPIRSKPGGSGRIGHAGDYFFFLLAFLAFFRFTAISSLAVSGALGEPNLVPAAQAAANHEA